MNNSTYICPHCKQGIVKLISAINVDENILYLSSHNHNPHKVYITSYRWLCSDCNFDFTKVGDGCALEDVTNILNEI